MERRACLALINLTTGKVHALVKERHRSREFLEFLKLLDAGYPASPAIRLILDNHSSPASRIALSFGAIRLRRGLAAHISKETKAWLATQPEGRLTFVLTPKHGSWLNLVEGFFSKLARSVVRVISGSLPNKSSKIASWPPSPISTDSPSSTPGPTNSMRPLDMIRSSETLHWSSTASSQPSRRQWSSSGCWTGPCCGRPFSNETDSVALATP
jgi:transposase